MEKIIAHIIKNKIPCYFLSPHLDDAVLSAGGLISSLSGNTSVTVVNIFTTAGEKSTLSAKKSIQKAGFSDPKKYYKERVLEDSLVMKKMQVKVRNLGIAEALWRNKYSVSTISKLLGKFVPEALTIYPTYRFHIIGENMSSHDLKTVSLILKKLSFIEKDAYVFAPLAVGQHVDHVVAFNVAEHFKNTIYWSDFPYNIIDLGFAGKGKKHIFRTNWKAKEGLLKMYKTQFNLLFPSGKMPKKNEVFFSNI